MIQEQAPRRRAVEATRILLTLLILVAGLELGAMGAVGVPSDLTAVLTLAAATAILVVLVIVNTRGLLAVAYISIRRTWKDGVRWGGERLRSGLTWLQRLRFRFFWWRVRRRNQTVVYVEERIEYQVARPNEFITGTFAPLKDHEDAGLLLGPGEFYKNVDICNYNLPHGKRDLGEKIGRVNGAIIAGTKTASGLEENG